MLHSQHVAGFRNSVWVPRIVFVVSAALAALALRLAWDEPIAGAIGLALLLALIGARWWSRRRAQRLLRSGDVASILARWSRSLSRVPHPETMGPLMTATAFAAYGWTERARAALRSAERGPAWEAALEHRLFIDALLLTFEGEGDEALARAGELEKLPLPSAAPMLIERVRVLREAVAALARAFSHRSVAGDQQIMIDASQTSPLVHWAMRYGAAIVALDADKPGDARQLLSGAPEWPSESCFSIFHGEISAELARREQTPPVAAGSPVDAQPPDANAPGPVVQEEGGSDPRHGG